MRYGSIFRPRRADRKVESKRYGGGPVPRPRRTGRGIGSILCGLIPRPRRAGRGVGLKRCGGEPAFRPRRAGRGIASTRCEGGPVFRFRRAGRKVGSIRYGGEPVPRFRRAERSGGEGSSRRINGRKANREPYLTSYAGRLKSCNPSPFLPNYRPRCRRGSAAPRLSRTATFPRVYSTPVETARIRRLATR